MRHRSRRAAAYTLLDMKTLDGMTRRAGGFSVWKLIRDARAAAGLTQQALAERAATAQSAIARYESARSLPDIDTLQRVLAACGQRLDISATTIDQESYRQLEESLKLTPRERLERNRRVTRLAEKAARAHREGRVRPLRRA